MLLIRRENGFGFGFPVRWPLFCQLFHVVKAFQKSKYEILFR
jgi:hypothetical protein